MEDRRPILASEDYGKDEWSSDALLQRHQRLEKEIGAYASEVKRLAEHARNAAQMAALTVRLHDYSYLAVIYLKISFDSNATF